MTSTPPVALLAGLLCDDEIWRDVASLVDGAARSRIFFFAGCDAIGAMADHVLREMDGPFAVAGHSMGGRVALEIIRKAPQRITGVALLNTGVHRTKPTEAASRGELVRVAHDQGMRALALRWLPPMMGRVYQPEEPLFERLVQMVERSTPPHFAAQIQALLGRPEAESVLEGIAVPTVLMSATEDRWSPVEQHREMQRRVPHATLEIVDEAGHMAPVEQPAAVAAVLSRWLTRIS